MQVLSDDGTCPEGWASGAVVTIGTYDGVHRGHIAVLSQMRALANERQCASAVITFDPHPARIVRPESAPLLLCDLSQRLELLEKAGVDVAVVVKFDAAAAKETPSGFVERVLVHQLQAQAVIVGHDFHFGVKRRGNVPFLASMGAVEGFDVMGLRLTEEATGGTEIEVVSSTRIRGLIAEGKVEAAAVLLGRAHEVRGPVEHGDKRGRELGFPTANVSVPDGICVPADGVYAGWYILPTGQRVASAISVGRRPQFYEEVGLRLIEPYLLDWSGDLYDTRARVQFAERLRGQMTFDGPGGLIDQIILDVEATRKWATDF